MEGTIVVGDNQNFKARVGERRPEAGHDRRYAYPKLI